VQLAGHDFLKNLGVLRDMALRNLMAFFPRRHGAWCANWGATPRILDEIDAAIRLRDKVRDRGDVSVGEKIRFTSSILPKWARRTKSLDALLPVLYLRGVSAGDFQEGLAALLGKDAPNLSPAEADTPQRPAAACPRCPR
jgi:hypothetical protein